MTSHRFRRAALVPCSLIAAAAGAFFLWPSEPPSPAAEASKEARDRQDSRRQGWTGSNSDGDRDGFADHTMDSLQHPAEALGGDYHALVVDSAGLPVAAAAVEIKRLGTDAPQSQETDTNGSVAFEGLPAGHYTVQARKGPKRSRPLLVRAGDVHAPAVLRLQAPPRYRVTVRDSEGQPIVGAQVTVTPGPAEAGPTDETGTRALGTLPPGDHSIAVQAEGAAIARRRLFVSQDESGERTVSVQMVAGGTIVGRVVDGSGRPIEGARVTARHAGAIDGFESGAAGTSKSDEAGGFQIKKLHTGSYLVRARAEGFAASQRPCRLTGGSKCGPVTLTLHEGGQVFGRISTDAGAPVANIAIRLTRTQSGYLHSEPRGATSDEAGEFHFSDLEAGEYAVSGHGQDGHTEPLHFALKRGQVHEVALALSAGQTIAGRVQDDQGSPVTGATVHLARHGSSDDVGALAARTRTNESGSFAFSGVASGAHRLSATWPGTTTKGGDSTVATAGTKDVTLVLSRPASIGGSVALEDGSVPEGFEVLARGKVVYVATEGTPEFEVDGLDPGSLQIALRGQRFEPLITNVHLAPGEHRELGVLTVATGRKLSGRVVDASGVPIVGADVYVGHFFTGDATTVAGGPAPRSSHFKQTQSQAEGHYELKGLASDGLLVVAEHRAHGRSTPMPISRLKEHSDLVLYGGARLSGHVVEDGQPVHGALIALTSVDRAVQSHASVALGATSDAEGHYVVERLPPGSYRVAAMLGGAPGAKTQTLELTVEPSSLEIERDFGFEAEGVTVALAPPATDGEFLASWSMKGSGGSHVGRLRTDEPTVLRGVVPGRYVLCMQQHQPIASGPGQPPCRSVEVAAQDDQTLQL